MKRTAAYRIASDICFFYAILSIFPSLAPWGLPMALFAAAALAVSLAAIRVPRAPLRFLLALLPGLVFLRARLAFPLVFPALAWLYLVLSLTAGRFEIWLEGYRRSFRVMLGVCLFSLIASVQLNVIKPGVTLVLPGLAYALAFFCLGVFALRRLQMNAEMSRRWNLANAAAVLGVPLLSVGVSLLLWLLLCLFRPVGAPLLYSLRRFIAWLINTLLPIRQGELDPEPSPTPEPTLSPAEEKISEPVWEKPTPQLDLDLTLDPARLERLRMIAVAALLALLVLALVALVVWRARRGRAVAAKEAFSYAEGEDAAPARKEEKAPSASDPSYARQIRQYYRGYMKLARRRGVRIRRGSTSRDILEETERISLSPEARRLRALYLAARYGGGESVGYEEAQEARLCLQKIREELPRSG